MGEDKICGFIICKFDKLRLELKKCVVISLSSCVVQMEILLGIRVLILIAILFQIFLNPPTFTDAVYLF